MADKCTIYLHKGQYVTSQDPAAQTAGKTSIQSKHQQEVKASL